jgi:hypothetical protein
MTKYWNPFELHKHCVSNVLLLLHNIVLWFTHLQKLHQKEPEHANRQLGVLGVLVNVPRQKQALKKIN